MALTSSCFVAHECGSYMKRRNSNSAHDKYCLARSLRESQVRTGLGPLSAIVAVRKSNSEKQSASAKRTRVYAGLFVVLVVERYLVGPGE